MTVLTARFDEALRYAHEIHAGNQRQGAPMIAHLMSVAGLVLELGGSENEAIGALLHDAAEETGGRDRVADIARHFGEDVARIVDECTDTYDDSLGWREKKAAYLARLPTAGADSLLVSAADKLCNVRRICVEVRSRGREAWSGFAGGRQGRVWYYEALVGAYNRAGENRVTPHLRAAVREMLSL